MNCVCCNGVAKRRGFYRNKNFNVQRYECLRCGTSFSDKQPLDNLRVDFKQACTVLSMLAEGLGIRAVSRLTGLHQQTVLNVLARAGGKAKRFLDLNIREIRPESVQVDEMFCFVGCKDRANKFGDPFKGDQYLYLGIDSKSKLIISHAIGKRYSRTTGAFLKDLHNRITGHFQLTSDGFENYKFWVGEVFKGQTDFAQLIKLYANPKDLDDPERRYSPTRCIGFRKVVRHGHPNPDLISTSFIERQNLNVRLFNRRFTRLTLGFSKKFEYLCHSINTMIFYQNYIRIHKTHGQTPAMAAGLTSEPWTFERLLLTPD